MGRAPCCDKANVKKGPWAPEEDAKLKEFIEKHGTGGNWIALPQKAGLKRCGKSCRLRWLNYLRPNIKHGEFSDDEDRIICSLYASIGSRWSIIAAQLPGRTDNDIKNYWNTKLKKKLLAMVPSTHKKSPFSPSLFQPQQPSQEFASYYTQLSSMTSLTSLLNHQEQLPLPLSSSNALNMNNFPSVFQPQESLYSPVQYSLGVKEGLLMFGNEATTTCSSSDNGSCMSQISYGKDIKQEYHITFQGYNTSTISSNRFREDHQNPSFVIDYGNNGVGGFHDQNHDHDPQSTIRGYFGNCSSNVTPLQYDLEEVKQLMTGTSNGSLNTNNNNSNSYCLLNDENKIHAKETMYYY